MAVPATASLTINSFLLCSMSIPYLNTGGAHSTRWQRSFTKLSHLPDDSGQKERLARSGAKRNLRQLGDAEPAEAVPARQAGGGVAHFQPVMVMGDGMPDLADSRADFSGGKVLGHGQIPKSCHTPRGGAALMQQDAAAIAHHQQHAVEPDGSGLAQFHRQLRGGAFPARLAASGKRADQAGRMSRQADGGAEFHERLVEMAGRARVQPPLRDFAETCTAAAV